MNNLSWLIYLSDILPGVGFAFGFFGCMGMFAAAFVIVISINEKNARGVRWGVFGSFVAILVGLTGLLMPSKEAVLMIAASEMGETVVKTPEAQEIFSDLKTILKQQLQALKK